MIVYNLPALTSDYLNHFGEFVMLLEMLPEAPEVIEDARDWAPRTYQAHLAGMKMSNAESLMRDYERLEPARKALLEDASANANRLGAAIVAALRDPKISAERLSGIIHLGCGAMHAHIRRLSAIISGLPVTQIDLPGADLQARIDGLLVAAA